MRCLKSKTLTEYPSTARVATQPQPTRPRQSIKFKDKKQITLAQPTQEKVETTRLGNSKDGNISRRGGGAGGGGAEEDAGSKERDGVESEENNSADSEKIWGPDSEDEGSEDDEN